MLILSGDPVTNNFNNWLRDYGMFLAIGVAVILLFVVAVILINNKKNKS